jgi:RNA polymerase sigma-70 factor (ECF subfamily)
LDPSRWVDEHGDILYRFALLRVRHPETAEDLVQETLVTAVRSSGRFRGQSSARTWLVGILKHKILDHYRKIGRETPFTDLESLRDELPEKFADGYWNHDRGPADWGGRADDAVDRREFWQTLQNCLGKLPPRLADVFLLREMDDVAGPEICRTLQISESNLWVMLHRARLALRECLEIHWFGRKGAP